ncbi:MAG: hypothetical protein Q8L53_15035 [Aestuariivirga sp.]|nr:hypothetical protein [Aestuariivirga sp.]
MTACIIIVMAIVYFVLRHLTDLQGWNFVAIIAAWRFGKHEAQDIKHHLPLSLLNRAGTRHGKSSAFVCGE